MSVPKHRTAGDEKNKGKEEEIARTRRSRERGFHCKAPERVVGAEKVKCQIQGACFAYGKKYLAGIDEYTTHGRLLAGGWNIERNT
jgi:hypothetical protein